MFAFIGHKYIYINCFSNQRRKTEDKIKSIKLEYMIE